MNSHQRRIKRRLEQRRTKRLMSLSPAQLEQLVRFLGIEIEADETIQRLAQDVIFNEIECHLPEEETNPID